MGLWTDKLLFLFDPDNELSEYVLEDSGNITDTLDSIMITRAVIYQVFPLGTIFSLFVQSTAKV